MINSVFMYDIILSELLCILLQSTTLSYTTGREYRRE